MTRPQYGKRPPFWRTCGAFFFFSCQSVFNRTEVQLNIRLGLYSDVSRIVCPLEQRLPLSRPTREVPRLAVLLHLRHVPSEGSPTFDLTLVIRAPSPHIVATVPLEPATRIFVIDPSPVLPIGEWLGRADAKVVQFGIVTFGAELCVGEPICWEFFGAVRHVFAAENAKREHFLRSQLGMEIGMKVLSYRLG